MGLWGEWRAARDRRRRAGSYLGKLLPTAEPEDIRWLTSFGAGDLLAIRELAFAQRAIGLIVAERDALDDRTASDVAHQLAQVIDRESRQSPNTGRAWAERWRAYTAALAVRGGHEAPGARLARVMLAGAEIAEPTNAQLVRATQFVHATRGRANEALRAAFGVASLPEDIKPSALRINS